MTATWELELRADCFIWSDETRRILGLPDGDSTLHTFITCVHPEDRQRLIRAHEHLLQDPTPVSVEFRIVTPDGETRLVQARGHVKRDAAGVATAIAGTLEDVTEPTLSGQQLREQRLLIETAGRTARLGGWAVDLPPTCVKWSDEVCAIHEVPPGTSPTVEEAIAFCAAEARPRIQALVAACITEGRPFDDEFEIETARGQRLWVRAIGRAVRDATGAVVRVEGALQDLTARKQLELERQRAQEAIRESDHRFRLVARATTDTIWDWDLVSDTVWWSDGIHTHFGYPEAAVQPESAWWLSLIHPDDKDDLSRGIHAAIAERRADWVGEYRFRRYDGSYAYVLDRGFLLLDAHGRAVRMVGGMTDLTSSRENQERLRRSEEHTRGIVESALDCIISIDRNGIILEFNPAAERTFGYRREEVIGRTLTDVIIPPGLREAHRAGIARYQQTGTAAVLGRRMEMPAQRADGTQITVELSLTALGSLPDPVFIGFLRDITDRRRAEDQLREQASLLESARDAIVVTTMDHHIRFWNGSAARLFGWTAAEAVGQALTELLYSNYLPFQQAYEQLLVAGEWVGELTTTARSGQEVILESRWTLLRDAEGRPTSILMIHTDITERRKLEQQFLRAQRMESIGTLAGGLAHDLNNVLTPVLLSVDILTDTITDPDALGLLSTIHESARRAADIVRQVLSFARGMDGRRLAVEVGDLLAGIERIVHETFPKNIAVRTELTGDVPAVAGDPTQLHQVLLNLCLNARDAMPEGGELTLSASVTVAPAQPTPDSATGHQARYVRIAVSDTGTGIPPELRHKIFEPFFTTKEVGKGTGLGLSTSLAIVTSHHGFITCHSARGLGTTIDVCLPAACDGKLEVLPDDSGALPRGAGETVLVIDDEPLILTASKRILESAGFRVLVASNGLEGVDAFKRHEGHVDAVLTDMMMPVMDGPAAIRALTALDPGLPIVAASGVAVNDYVAQAAALGVKNFLAKPYSPRTLVRTVRAVIDERHPR